MDISRINDNPQKDSSLNSSQVSNSEMKSSGIKLDSSRLFDQSKSGETRA
jgi:hypothetical protein